MYSVLKTQKRAVSHHKNVPPTTCIFLTDTHFLLTFSDCCLQIYSLQLTESANNEEALLYEIYTKDIISHSARLSNGKCVLLAKKCKELLVLSI